MPKENPRGRVCFDGTLFKIFIGEDCPDFPIDTIKNKFGLMIFEPARIKVIRHYHWNTKR